MNVFLHRNPLASWGRSIGSCNGMRWLCLPLQLVKFLSERGEESAL